MYYGCPACNSMELHTAVTVSDYTAGGLVRDHTSDSVRLSLVRCEICENHGGYLSCYAAYAIERLRTTLLVTMHGALTTSLDRSSLLRCRCMALWWRVKAQHSWSVAVVMLTKLPCDVLHHSSRDKAETVRGSPVRISPGRRLRSYG